MTGVLNQMFGLLFGILSVARGQPRTSILSPCASVGSVGSGGGGSGGESRLGDSRITSAGRGEGGGSKAEQRRMRDQMAKMAQAGMGRMPGMGGLDQALPGAPQISSTELEARRKKEKAARKARKKNR